MPRHNNGTFSRVTNWTQEHSNNETFTGAKLDKDSDDLAQGIQDSLDILGRNSMQASLSMNNHEIENLRHPSREGSAVNFEDALKLSNKYEAPFFFTEDISSKETLTIKLKLVGTQSNWRLPIIPQGMSFRGFRFKFICDLSYNSQDIIRVEGYERIELNVGSQVLSGYVVRQSYHNDQDIKPSFKKGGVYQMEAIPVGEGTASTWRFREFDYVKEGTIIYLNKSLLTDITPSGYRLGQYLPNAVPNLANNDYISLEKIILNWSYNTEM